MTQVAAVRIAGREIGMDWIAAHRRYFNTDETAACRHLEALITPELVGSSDPANFWPQPYLSAERQR